MIFDFHELACLPEKAGLPRWAGLFLIDFFLQRGYASGVRYEDYYKV